ncbi:MAG: hypothetical protein HKN87_12200 [Saprospiraceae bacterium]|nr:hypothetical protein [Saprospiraceae bacterium]
MNREADILKAGAAQTEITPPLGTRIGVDLFPHYARFIHDKLYAKTLLLSKGDVMIAFVVVDICIMPSDLMLEIKQSITGASGIPLRRIMLSCTHTHGAGDVAGLLGGAVDIAYRKRLPAWIVSSVEKAMSRLETAAIGYGAVSVPQHVVSRRYVMRPECKAQNPVSGLVEHVKMNPLGEEDLILERCGLVDPEVCYLAIKNDKDELVSILANYGLHYVGDWDVDTITADYYGAFAEKIQSRLHTSTHFVGIMTHGTAGNVNIWDFLDPNRYPTTSHATTELIGEDLAIAVLLDIEKVVYYDQVDLTMEHSELDLAVRKPSRESLSRSERLLRKNRFDDLIHDDHGLAMIYAREQLLLKEYPDLHQTALQGIRIGDLRIGVLGGEIFAETGLWLKEQFPQKQYFTICLANTYDGYVPPAHEHERGGYETWRARSSFLEKHAEEKIRQELVTLLQKL